MSTTLTLNKIIEKVFGKHKSPIVGDPFPMNVMLRIITLFYSNSLQKSITRLAFVYLVIYYNLGGYYIFISKGPLLTSHIVGIGFAIIPSLTYLLYILKYEEGDTALYEDMEFFKPLLNLSKSVQGRIYKKLKFIKVAFIMVEAGAISSILLWCPIFGDKKEFMLILQINDYYFKNSYLNAISYQFYILFMMHTVCSSLNTVWFIVYITYELQFQLFILNDDLKHLSLYCEKMHLGIAIEDEFAQKQIFNKLRSCIVHYQGIKKFKNDLHAILYFAILSYAITGIIFVCALTGFLIFQISPANNDIMATYTILVSIIILILVDSGQGVINESSNIFNIIITFPTYALNVHNKKILLTFITNLQDILNFKCIMDISISHSVLIKVFRGVYTALSILYTLILNKE